MPCTRSRAAIYASRRRSGSERGRAPAVLTAGESTWTAPLSCESLRVKCPRCRIGRAPGCQSGLACAARHCARRPSLADRHFARTQRASRWRPSRSSSKDGGAQGDTRSECSSPPGPCRMLGVRMHVSGIPGPARAVLRPGRLHGDTLPVGQPPSRVRSVDLTDNDSGTALLSLSGAIPATATAAASR
jgi:hypothetical protein